jgi:hypothetical protein
MIDNLLMTAILSMDAYNEGGSRQGVFTGKGIGSYIGDAMITDLKDDPGTDFDAVAYNWLGTPIIAYRGTDNPPPTLANGTVDYGDVLAGWIELR